MARTPGSLNKNGTSAKLVAFLDSKPGRFFSSNELPAYLGMAASDIDKLYSTLHYLKTTKRIVTRQAPDGQSRLLYGSKRPLVQTFVPKTQPPASAVAVPVPAPTKAPVLSAELLASLETEINVRAKVLAKAEVDVLTIKLQAAVNRFAAEMTAILAVNSATAAPTGE